MYIEYTYILIIYTGDKFYMMVLKYVLKCLITQLSTCEINDV